MTLKRTNIRDTFASLLSAEVAPDPVEVNRAHSSSLFPLINLVSGLDSAIIENHTNTDKPRRYRLKAQIKVASNDHDTDIDNFIEKIDNVIEANRKNQYWSACFLVDIDEPEDVPGEITYSVCNVEIEFMYEV